MIVFFFANKNLIKMILLLRDSCDVTFLSDVIRHSRHFCEIMLHSKHSSLTSLDSQDVPDIPVTSKMTSRDRVQKLFSKT